MRKAIVVDLDGTLLRTNTFIHYIKFVFEEALVQGNVFKAGWIGLLVFLRKIRIISSHEKLKKDILISSRRYVSSYMMEEFATILYEYENKRVVSLMEKYRNKGFFTILSTAAPSVYAEIIGNHYHFDFVCSTAIPTDENWRENVNEQKKKNTFALLEQNSLEMAVLVTDHYDDLPLLSVVKEVNYVVNPSYKTLKLLKENGIKFEAVYDK